MPNYTTDDFSDISADELSDVFSSSYALSGQPGSPEYLEDAVEALGHADGDIYYDADRDAAPAAAAAHANITRLQQATAYAARIMRALAANPDLLAQVQAAMDEGPAPKI